VSERFAKAKKLKLVITAGIGSDHTDLAEASARNVDVLEVQQRLPSYGIFLSECPTEE
jgi:lactate dehydrogenase-like 2-hydroxyacid dehydrogenase